MKTCLVVLLIVMQACVRPGAAVQEGGLAAEPAVSPRAARLYESAFVIDTHNDMPTKMLDDGYDADARHAPGFAINQGETDVPRLLESGLSAVFLSAWVDAPYAAESPDRSFERAIAYMDTIHALVKRHPGRLMFATTAGDVRAARASDRVAILIGVEGGHAIENSLANLRELYRRGARYMTLTWNNGNDWAGSSTGVNGTRKGGLTPFGRYVVREMNRLGMLVDVSHVSDSTFFDAVATSTAPVIASHSSARALNQHWRNLSDEQLRAIAQNGGVVNVNFYSVFVDQDFLNARAALDRRIGREVAMRLAAPGADTAAIRAAGEKRIEAAARVLPRPPLAIVLDHIDHIRDVAGIDHVGIGSDFDGVGGFLPQGLDDVTCLPLIAQGLLDRGYSDEEVRKVLGGNMLRVMEQVLVNR